MFSSLWSSLESPISIFNDEDDADADDDDPFSLRRPGDGGDEDG